MGKKRAKFKFNNGVQALICSRCGAIIKEGTFFTEEEWKASKGEIKLIAQYCDKCEEKYIYND